MNLILSFLGTFDVRLNSQPARFATARARALLSYLAVEADRPHRREALADLLWPDHPEAVARQNLSQDLARLRRAIQDAPTAVPHLQVTSTTIQFNAASAEVDVMHFQSLVADCAHHRHDAIESCSDCINRLRAAIALYHGDFLGGFSLKDNQPFNEWSLYQREHLHRQALDALEVLVRHALGAADYSQARQYAQRQVELEPWYEEGHRHLMRALAATGQRSVALAQYDICRRILAAELGVEPSSETRALYEHIRDTETDASPRPQPARVLPSPLTPFIGRTRELAEIHMRLREPGVRLLTLVGIGGMGKTRLAIEAARAHADACPEGLYFVSLASLPEPATLASAIAGALGLTLQGTDIWAEVLRALQQRKALLILDDFESLPSLPDQPGVEEVERNAVRAVVELLEAAPDVQVIATARVRLGIPGEHVYIIEGLDYPAQASVEQAAAAPAVSLLVNSARRRDPHFSLNASNVVPVLRICDLVQGMPLGIELAAVWLELLKPAEVAAEIERSIDFLADERAEVMSRQRSLRGVFEWSWQRLNASERRALRRLSVFSGGFSREAAQAVAEASLRELTGLVYKSLLRWNSALAGGGSYELHEVICQLAAEQLDQDRSERDAVEARHAAYYLGLLEGFETRVDTLEAADAIRQVQTEAVHIDQAWAWAVAHRDLDRLNRTFYSLWQFYFITGRWAESERAFRLAVERLRGAERGPTGDLAMPGGNVALLSKMLAGHAHTLNLLKQDERALAVAAEAIELGEVSDALEGLILGEMLRGIILHRMGSPHAARPRFERALALSQQHHGDFPGEMLWDVEWSCEVGLTGICLASGDMAGAESHIHRALQVCQSRGKRHGEAYCLFVLGERAYHVRDYPTARGCYEQVLRLELQVGDRRAVSVTQLSLGETLRMQGDYGQALDLLERALAHLAEVRDLDESKAVARFSRLDLYLGNLGRACERLARLAEASDMVRSPEVQTFTLLTQALLALQAGEPERALAHAEEARQLLQGPSSPYDQAVTLIIMGHAAAATGRRPEARTAYQQAVRLCEMLAAPALAAEGYAGLANVASGEGDDAAALAHVETLVSILAEHPRVGLDEPFTTYLACCRVLAAAHDQRTTAILAQGHALLMDYADHIANAAQRQSFLGNVVEHRELHRLYTQYAASQLHDQHPCAVPTDT